MKGIQAAVWSMEYGVLARGEVHWLIITVIIRTDQSTTCSPYHTYLVSILTIHPDDHPARRLPYGAAGQVYASRNPRSGNNLQFQSFRRSSRTPPVTHSANSRCKREKHHARTLDGRQSGHFPYGVESTVIADWITCSLSFLYIARASGLFGRMTNCSKSAVACAPSGDWRGVGMSNRITQGM